MSHGKSDGKENLFLMRSMIFLVLLRRLMESTVPVPYRYVKCTSNSFIPYGTGRRSSKTFFNCTDYDYFFE